MLLLANENFPRVAIEALRASGHDVLWIRTDFPGATDEQVLQLAQQSRRILLTLDNCDPSQDTRGDMSINQGLKQR